MGTFYLVCFGKCSSCREHYVALTGSLNILLHAINRENLTATNNAGLQIKCSSCKAAMNESIILERYF